MSGFVIGAVHAFIVVDPEDGDEGIPAFVGPGGMWMPMVAADEDRVRSLRPMAEKVARETGQTVKFVRFSVREDLETIGGDDDGP